MSWACNIIQSAGYEYNERVFYIMDSNREYLGYCPDKDIYGRVIKIYTKLPGPSW